MAEAVARGRITDTLRAVHADRSVAWAHVYEYVILSAVLLLMVFQPF